jgi:crossover junction endodeoxyribonuclease RuvC
MNSFVGIDIGKGGAISLIRDDGYIESYVTPTLPNGDIDVNSMYVILAGMHHVKMVVVERVHAIFGSSASSTFEFGRSAGIVEGIVCVSRLPYTMVAPKEWQKEMWSGIAKVKKSGKNSTDTKATSLVAVKRLFPNANLLDKSKPRSQKVHDGVVDSILMAEYARRIWKGQKQ